MTDYEVQQMIAGIGARIFAVRIASTDYGREYQYWIHPQKTSAEWREDVSGIIKNLYAIDHDDGGAADDVYNTFHNEMQKLGYHEICDVVSDVFECRVSVEAARIVPDPDHEEDTTGFGHFGWESRSFDKPS